MPRLTLPAALSDLLPIAHGRTASGQRSVVLESQSWPDIAKEIHRRFPGLADRMFVDGDAIAPGFILVVNDQVVPRGQIPLDVSDSTELSLLAALAGG